MADLAERFGQGDIRFSHEQNIILPHVACADLPLLHKALKGQGLGTANVGLVSDIIACPGMDYCAGHRALDPGGARDRRTGRGAEDRATSAP
ncbi:MAG: hypothetical protein H6898_12530 [Rhodobacter sp.]|nr:hypothetical protein [Rhodobacter sp.]